MTNKLRPAAAALLFAALLAAAPAFAETPSPTPDMNGVTKYYSQQQKAAEATDGTILMRSTAETTEDNSNVIKKVRHAEKKEFLLIGEKGDFYLAELSGTQGFVRKKDFKLKDASPSPTPSPTPALSPSPTPSGRLNTSTSGSTQTGSGASSEKWGSIKIPGGSTLTIYGNYLNSAGNRYYYSAENKKGHYEYVHTMTARGSQVHSVLGHNVRGKAKYFHKLHHVQNALIGKSRCEGCGGSCSGSKTTKITMKLDGYSTWDVYCLYEIGPKQSTSILSYNAKPWGASTRSYVDTQLSYAAKSENKGWINPNVSYSDSGKYAMLITCGDKYESSQNATSKLYVLLKARD